MYFPLFFSKLLEWNRQQLSSLSSSDSQSYDYGSASNRECDICDYPFTVIYVIKT